MATQVHTKEEIAKQEMASQLADETGNKPGKRSTVVDNVVLS